MTARPSLAVLCTLLVVLAALSVGAVAFVATALVLIGALTFVAIQTRRAPVPVRRSLLVLITPRHRARASLLSALR